jgi:hypothetical protein
LGKSRATHPLPTSKSDPCVLSRETQEKQRKLHFQDVLNKNSAQAHTESELGVPGVPGKLGKNLVHWCQEKIKNKK